MDITVMNSDSDSDASSVDMEEYQALLQAQGEKGTKTVKKTFYNNVEGMQAKIMTLAESTGSMDQSMSCTVENDRDEEFDAHDDFKREEAFMQQAKAAVKVVLPRLAAAGVSIERPSDYFAEMVKSDEHMKKIKAKLLSEEQSLEQSEKARKQRELKKFGKKVQHEVLEKRRKEKRDALESVKKMKTQKMSRDARDAKFGFGKRDAGKKGGGRGAGRGGGRGAGRGGGRGAGRGGGSAGRGKGRPQKKRPGKR